MMRRHARLYGLLLLFAGIAASAQQRPIFEPDDSVDPNRHYGTAFVSRLIAGGAAGLVDDYRPLHRNAGFLLLANSLYWGRFQLDYKVSDVGGPKSPVDVCLCNGHPIYFPTPPSADSTPEAPPPGPKHTTQFGWYRTHSGGPAETPVTRRYRLSLSWQPIDSTLRNIATGTASHNSGRERSFGLDADTYFRFGAHDVWGSLFYARTVSTGTTDNRSQNELAYTSRFPGRELGPILIRATLTVGGVSNRGASGLNVVNPAFEAFWHNGRTDVNVHLVWSPLATRSGTAGWETHGQVALFVDRALFARLLSHSDAPR